ncbi:MAG: hypothetical protein JW751_13030 [Polyangiaceae bacterium]|nr:hypothetical protein [Polyangiaceae bacterium]
MFPSAGRWRRDSAWRGSALGATLAALAVGCGGCSPASSGSDGGVPTGGARSDAPSGGQRAASLGGGGGQLGGAGTGGTEQATGGSAGASSGGGENGGATRGGGVTGGLGAGGGGSDTGGGGTGGGVTGGTGSESTGGASDGGTDAGGTGSSSMGGASDGGTDTGGATSGGANQVGAEGGEPELPAGLYWDFEAIEQGEAAERSGSGPSLVVENASPGAGLLGSGLVLNGAEAGQASAPLSVIDTTGDYSIAVWVRLDEVGVYNTFVSEDAERVSAFYLQLRNKEAFAFTTFPTDDTKASSCVAMGTMLPRAGEWYHLVATRNAATGEQRLYQDGVLVAAATCTGSLRPTGSLVVGRGLWDGAPADHVTGCVDELYVTDAALSPREVVDMYLHDRPGAEHYLFAYFAEQAQGRGDGLRLAHSHDGLHWGAIGDHRVFMPPEVGGGSFRDPHVMRAPDGNYHLVFTTTCVPWAESGCIQDRGFGHAASPDLVTWSEQGYIPVDLAVEHAWAPETVYDAESGQFMVFWSSPLDINPGASGAHSIYYMLTSDFQTFTSPEVLYGRPSRNLIDATIYQGNDGYLMFLKDEADGQKNIRVVSSPTLFGANAWIADPSSPLTGNFGAEGPSALQSDGRLLLYFDKYDEGAYGALRSNGLTGLESTAAWEDISISVYFAGVRHGTPIRVPTDTFRAVAVMAGE